MWQESFFLAKTFNCLYLLLSPPYTLTAVCHVAAEFLPSGDPEVPLLALLAAGRDAAGRVGVQHGGAPLQAAQGHPVSHGDRAQAEAVEQLESAEKLVAPGEVADAAAWEVVQWLQARR